MMTAYMTVLAIHVTILKLLNIGVLLGGTHSPLSMFYKLVNIKEGNHLLYMNVAIQLFLFMLLQNICMNAYVCTALAPTLLHTV